MRARVVGLAPGGRGIEFVAEKIGCAAAEERVAEVYGKTLRKPAVQDDLHLVGARAPQGRSIIREAVHLRERPQKLGLANGGAGVETLRGHVLIDQRIGGPQPGEVLDVERIGYVGVKVVGNGVVAL